MVELHKIQDGHQFSFKGIVCKKIREFNRGSEDWEIEIDTPYGIEQVTAYLMVTKL